MNVEQPVGDAGPGGGLILGRIAAVIAAAQFAVTPAQKPHVPPWPAWWYQQALCIHSHESGNFHLYDPPYANGWQFTLSTWIRAGGTAADWVTATPKEQLYRVWAIWKMDGGSFREWPNTSRMCGAH